MNPTEIYAVQDRPLVILAVRLHPSLPDIGMTARSQKAGVVRASRKYALPKRV